MSRVPIRHINVAELGAYLKEEARMTGPNDRKVFRWQTLTLSKTLKPKLDGKKKTTDYRHVRPP